MAANPAYMALASSLRDAIARGDYGVGDRLPTEAELIQRSGLSRQTVRRAYLELTADGSVERVPGRGTFVAPPSQKYARGFGSVEDLLGFSLDTKIEVVSELQRRAHIEGAARLGLDADVVYSVEYVRSYRSIPFAWTTVTLSPEVAEALGDAQELSALGSEQPITVIGLLEQRLDLRISSADQTITAVAADAGAAGMLRVAPGTPLLRIDRLFLDDADRPVELSVGYFLPSQYTHRTRLNRA